MTTLFPTPTRLALLREVAEGTVCRYGDGNTYDPWQTRVTAAMATFAAAGWVVLGPPHPVKTAWLLTEAGREVLAAAEGDGRG